MGSIVHASKSFMLRYSPINKPSPIANRYLLSNNNCLQPKIAHMYATRDKNSLWWKTSASQLTSYRRVIRSWGSRRARVTFRKALQEQGFDEEGRRIELENQDGKQNNRKNLSGSLEVILRAHVIEEQFDVLQKDMQAGVRSLLTHIKHLEANPELTKVTKKNVRREHRANKTNKVKVVKDKVRRIASTGR
ncbi:hypothetical protein BO71DRAFT_395913 [Aspergillus ellipticus CBS 707.79]|uniref:Uncharacterized protein n=1 Tax=Aspergillus ellipticus CBS 707.79 TaxID=1448320 RepID=A0A319E1T3_9EURO|nr:hypothetical protein BO71DRAFT_395913 [Aspergillus ellipticus CBS 707.79]